MSSRCGHVGEPVMSRRALQSVRPASWYQHVLPEAFLNVPGGIGVTVKLQLTGRALHPAGLSRDRLRFCTTAAAPFGRVELID
jgi:hypothetical protein